MTKFPSTRECASGAHCMACRNSAGFRQTLQKIYGGVPTQAECPRKLADNTPLEEMPDEIKKLEETRKEQQREIMERAQKLERLLALVAKALPDVAKELHEILFPMLLPKAGPSPRCVYMQRTGERRENAPCREYILCHNPQSPIYQAHRVWCVADCRPTKCQFFSEKKEP